MEPLWSAAIAFFGVGIGFLLSQWSIRWDRKETRRGLATALLAETQKFWVRLDRLGESGMGYLRNFPSRDPLASPIQSALIHNIHVFKPETAQAISLYLTHLENVRTEIVALRESKESDDSGLITESRSAKDFVEENLIPALIHAGGEIPDRVPRRSVEDGSPLPRYSDDPFDPYR